MEGKLLEICSELLNGCNPRDDTLIEKLISSLQQGIHTDLIKQLAKGNEIQELLRCKLEHLDKISPDSIAAFIKVLSVLSDKEFDSLNKFNTLVIFIERCIQSPVVVAEKSVANAILFFLKSICFKKERLASFTDKGYIQFITDCLHDSSLFVVKSAKELFSMLLINDLYSVIEMIAVGSVKKDAGFSVLKCEGLPYLEYYKFCLKDIWLNVENRNIAVDITLDICTNPDHKNAVTFLVENCNIDDIVTEILTNCESLQSNLCLEVIKKLAVLGLLREDCQRKLLSLPVSLLNEGKLLASVQLCRGLLQICDCEINLKEVEICLFDALKKTLSNCTDQYQLKVVMCGIKALSYVKHLKSKVLKFLCSLIIFNDLGCTENSNHFHGCRQPKFLQLVLGVISSFLTASIGSQASSELMLCMKACCGILSDIGARYQVVSKALACIHEILHQVKQMDSPSESTLQLLEIELTQLGQFLSQKLMNLKWEVRDSSIEFVGNLAALADGFPVLLRWIERENLGVHIWQDVEDGESYVRATAINAMKHWLQKSETKILILKIVPPDVMFSKLVCIVREDTEAFARRAAIDFFTELFDVEIFQAERQQIINIMSTSINDLDWEVKLRVLTFWEIYVEKYLPKCITNTKSTDTPDSATLLQEPVKRKLLGKTEDIIELKQVLENLSNAGLPQVLLTSVEDCDKSVQQKACVLLRRLKATCQLSNYFNTIGQSDAKKTKLDSNNIASTDIMKKFLGKLESFDIDKFLENASQSTDGYHNNLESLLDDIQASMKISETNTENNDISIDCY